MGLLFFSKFFFRDDRRASRIRSGRPGETGGPETRARRGSDGPGGDSGRGRRRPVSQAAEGGTLAPGDPGGPSGCTGVLPTETISKSLNVPATPSRNPSEKHPPKDRHRHSEGASGPDPHVARMSPHVSPVSGLLQRRLVIPSGKTRRSTLKLRTSKSKEWKFSYIRHFFAVKRRTQ